MKRQAGFTLWEFLTIIIILGILMVYVAPRLFMWQGTARIAKVKEVESAMRTANLSVYARAVLLGKDQADHEMLQVPDPNHPGMTIPIEVRYGYLMDTGDFAGLIDGVGGDGEPESSFWADGMSVRYANTPNSPVSCGVEYMPPLQNPMNPNDMNPTYTLHVDGC